MLPRCPKGKVITVVIVFELPKEQSQAQQATFVVASLFVAYVNEP
jgi:hypothetical protein